MTHRIHRSPLLIVLLLVIVPFSAWAQDDPGWIYLLSGDDATITVVPVSDPQARATIDLPIQNPRALYPTPGGKYVFVGFEDSPDLAVVDSESKSVERRLTLDGGRVEAMTFSARGNTAFVRFENAFAAYDHAAGELALREITRDGIADVSARHPQAAVNRRATRVYLSTDDGLGYFEVESLDQFRSVRAPADVWAMAPDYRFLWGVSEERVTIVDERRGRVVGRVNGSFVVQPPVFMRTAGEVYLPDAGANRIAIIDDRRFRSRESIALPDRPVAATGDESRGVWTVTVDGNLLRFDTVSRELTSVAALGSVFTDMTYVGFKPDGGFACF